MSSKALAVSSRFMTSRDAFQRVLSRPKAAETLDDAPEFLRFARDEKVDSVRFCGFVPVGRGRRKQVIHRLGFGQDLDRLREFVAASVTDGPPMVLFDPAFGPLPPGWGFHECMAGIETLYISSIGDVYPCTSLLNPRFVVGNLGERPLEELWNDPKMTSVASLPREDLASPCRECPSLPSCHGACRGITFAHTGDLGAAFPFCLRG